MVGQGKKRAILDDGSRDCYGGVCCDYCFYLIKLFIGTNKRERVGYWNR